MIFKPMDKNIKLSGKDILNEDMISTSHFHFSVPGLLRILVSAILTVLFVLSSFYVFEKCLSPLIISRHHDTNLFFGYKLILSFFVYCSVYMSIDLIILVYNRCIFTSSYRKNISSLVIYKKSNIIKISISLCIYCLLLYCYDYFIIPIDVQKNNVIKDTEPDFKLSQYIATNFSTIVLSISTVCILYLAKSITMCIVELKMFFSHYRERIEINEENIQIIEMLNRSTGLKMFPNLQTWGHYVFKTISPNDDILTFEKCESVFGTSYTNGIFGLFDANNDLTITAGEFVTGYYGVIREKYFLNQALLQKNNLFYKLNIIVSIMCLPFAVFVGISFLGFAKYFANLFSIISGIILSLSFVFSSVVGDIFRSLIFIFIVRPFEAGDYVKINDKIFIVEELGLLYSSFLIDSLLTYVQNSQLMSKHIVNYRVSEIEEKIYKFKFNIKSFKEKAEMLNRKIKKILKSDTQVYTGKYLINNYIILNDDIMTVEIVIYFKIRYQYIKGLLKNEDDFLLTLHDIFRDLDLKVC